MLAGAARAATFESTRCRVSFDLPRHWSARDGQNSSEWVRAERKHHPGLCEVVLKPDDWVPVDPKSGLEFGNVAVDILVVSEGLDKAADLGFFFKMGRIRAVDGNLAGFENVPDDEWVGTGRGSTIYKVKQLKLTGRRAMYTETMIGYVRRTGKGDETIYAGLGSALRAVVSVKNRSAVLLVDNPHVSDETFLAILKSVRLY